MRAARGCSGESNLRVHRALRLNRGHHAFFGTPGGTISISRVGLRRVLPLPHAGADRRLCVLHSQHAAAELHNAE